MAEQGVINDLFNALAETNFIGRRKPRRASRAALVEMIETLLAGRGEASSTERAAEFLRAYRDLDSAGRTFVLRTLADDYGPDAKALETAAGAYVASPDQNHAKALQKAAEPLIFVEVALTKEMPGAIGPILAAEREPIAPGEATAAVFYSISNCQEGLRGISFGNFLIKQVAGDLAKELPNLRTFATLSPVPGFAGWLAEMAEAQPTHLSNAAQSVLARIAEMPDWLADPALAKAAEAELMPLAAHYLTVARDASGRPRDPVARFHLGNGARLERINFAADPSPRGMAGAYAIMVNYRYVLAEVEENHEAFMAEGKVIAAPAVKRLAQRARFAEAAWPAETPARLEAPAKR